MFKYPTKRTFDDTYDFNYYFKANNSQTLPNFHSSIMSVKITSTDGIESRVKEPCSQP